MNIKLADHEIRLGNEVIATFKRFQQKGFKAHEAGGILLAQIRSKEIFILKASVPDKKDQSSRFRFLRQIQPAQNIIIKAFKESNHRTVYIGEWHTHPETSPSPSGQDIRMIKEQFSKGALNESFILLIIVGLRDLYVAKYDGELISTVVKLIDDN